MVATIITLLVIIFGLITALVVLFNTLKKSYQDYINAIEDNQLTDQEKLTLADDLILAIEQAKNIIELIKKLIDAFNNLKTKNNK